MKVAASTRMTYYYLDRYISIYPYIHISIYPYIHISIIFVQPLLSQRHKRREREGQATRVNTTIMETRRTTIAISVRNTPFPGFGVRTRRKTATANEMALLGDA